MVTTPKPPNSPQPGQPDLAQVHPAQGISPKQKNTVGKVHNKTSAAPSGASSNPSRPDVANTHDYLASVSPADIKGESQRLLQELGVAQQEGNLLRATQIKDGLWGLWLKAEEAGIERNDIPELAGMGAREAAGIGLALMGMGRGRGSNRQVQANRAGGAGGTHVLGTGRPCVVGKYSDIKGKCGKGGQAHHIVPDTLNRTSNRSQGSRGIGRIPGMPSLNDGPAICLQGNAKTQGSEHNTAHQCDSGICTAGKSVDNGPVGTIPVSEAVPMAMEAAIAARPDCADAIKQQVEKAYPNYKNDNRSMNAAGRPSTGDAKAHLESGGTANGNNSSPRGGRTGRR